MSHTTDATPPRPLPLLMVPLRRCGSHALRLRLNVSPTFHSPYPLHIVDFMPLVPHASYGRSGLLSHTSTPATSTVATEMS